MNEKHSISISFRLKIDFFYWQIVKILNKLKRFELFPLNNYFIFHTKEKKKKMSRKWFCNMRFAIVSILVFHTVELIISSKLMRWFVSFDCYQIAKWNRHVSILLLRVHCFKINFICILHFRRRHRQSAAVSITIKSCSNYIL